MIACKGRVGVIGATSLIGECLLPFPIVECFYIIKNTCFGFGPSRVFFNNFFRYSLRGAGGATRISYSNRI
jgi:hypothetical protein